MQRDKRESKSKRARDRDAVRYGSACIGGEERTEEMGYPRRGMPGNEESVEVRRRQGVRLFDR